MQPSLMPVRQEYVERLDVVRAVAVLWVMVFHFCGAMWGKDTGAWLAHWDDSPAWLRLPGQALVAVAGRGGLGVPIFFVLSGFLIHLTWSRSSNQDVRLFWWRRWVRIFPPYFVALIAFTIWHQTLSGKRGWSHFLTHLFLVHNFNDRTFFSINGSFWSLAIEAQFYVLYPLLLRLRQAVGMKPILLAALGARLLFNAVEMLAPGGLNGGPALSFMLPRLYFEWILGMYVADCLLQGRRAFSVSGWVGWGCVAYSLLASGGGWWSAGLVPAISLATAIWIDRMVHQPRPANIFERALMPLGVVSYSLYLWHLPILRGISRWVASQSWLTEWLTDDGRFALTFFASLVPAILVGTAMYWLVELPSQTWGRHFAKRWFPAVPSGAQHKLEAAREPTPSNARKAA